MIEHRLIEKMITVIQKSIPQIKETQRIDPVFMDTVIDFMRVYADRLHHGKEEDILFRDCESRDLSEEDRQLMQELRDEHATSRNNLAALDKAKQRYVEGHNHIVISEIVVRMQNLVQLYPAHIAKEDKVFFPHSEKYFTEEEQQDMLQEFWDFDKTMIHEKYRSVVEGLQV